DWVETVCLNRDGEPTLDKRLAARVALLKAAGIRKVTFATNAQLLTPKLSSALIDAGLDDIMVSIDGVTKEVFEAIRLRLSFETVLANTLELIRIRNQRQVPLSVRIRMVIMKENEHEVRPFFEFWNARVATQDRVYAKHAHTWGNQMGVEKESLVARFRDRPC